MERRKKILSLFIKLIVGIGSFAIIYLRLKSEFTAEKLTILSEASFSIKGIFSFVLCLLLLPINWGLEALKWQLITAPLQKISYRLASWSVYSGVCLGNLAPGRATEFVAKIIFFKPENRAKISVLHFVGGLFQLSITIIAGLLAMLYSLNRFGDESAWMPYLIGGVGLLALTALVFCIGNLNFILDLVARKISKTNQLEALSYTFSHRLIVQLFGFSALRYSVFFVQMLLLISIFHPINFSLCIGISLYFLITTLIPMISVLEAPIRAAIALLVFKDSGLTNTALALCATLMWIVNIILPSILGYIILVQQNFNFSLSRQKNEPVI